MDSTPASPLLVRRSPPPLASFVARSTATPVFAAKSATLADASSAKPASSEVSDDDGISFTDVLSMLNPLQYLPVLGSIYRAATGDTIPEAVRDIGSLAVSAVTGGPIGVAISAAALALEKIVGIEPDQLAQKVLAGLGIISDPQPQLAAADTTTHTATTHTTAPAATDGRSHPWNRSHRAAYASSAPRPTIAAPSRHADILAGAGVSAANEAAQRQAAAAAYSRRTLSRMEPLIRERVASHSA